MFPVNFQFIADRKPTFTTALLAVTNLNRLWYSGDGLLWNYHNLSGSIYDMASNGTISIGVGGGYAWLVTDLTGVTQVSMGGTASRITYGNGRWVAIGGALGRYSFVSTDNGASWNSYNVFADTASDVAYYDGYFVAVTGVSGGYKYYSTDGIAWSGPYYMWDGWSNPDPDEDPPILTYNQALADLSAAWWYSTGSLTDGADNLDIDATVEDWGNGTGYLSYPHSTQLASKYNTTNVIYCHHQGAYKRIYIDNTMAYEHLNNTPYEDAAFSANHWFESEGMWVVAGELDDGSGDGHLWTSFNGTTWTYQGQLFMVGAVPETVQFFCTPQTR